MQELIRLIFQEATGKSRAPGQSRKSAKFSGGRRPARPVRQEEGHRPIQNVKHFRGVWEFAQDASPAAARIPGKTGD